MNKGKILKNTGKVIGKVAATITIPPAGGVLWRKDFEGRVVGTIVGVGVSVAASVALLLCPYKTLNDSTKNYLSSHGTAPIIAGFACPIAFYRSLSPTTSVTGAGNISQAFNPDIHPINFENGKYQLTFDSNTQFNPPGPSEYISLVQAQEPIDKARARVSQLESQLDTALQEKGLPAARKIQDKLSEAREDLQSSRIAYNATKEEFDETQKIYQTQVDALNAELQEINNYVAQSQPFKDKQNPNIPTSQ